MISEENAIEILVKEDFCIFFGSGISMEAGLPNGKELSKELLMALNVQNDQAEIYSNEYHLERMIFLLGSILGEEVYNIYLSLDTEYFGKNHIALSNLNLEKNISLLTTNQDELIEKSSERIIDINNFIKIHGTLSRKESLRISLERVSKLSEDISKIISKITENKTILVIGYSFSDYDLRDFFVSSSNRLMYCAYDINGQNKFKEILTNGNVDLFDGRCIQMEKDSTFLSKLCNAFGIFNVEPKPFNIGEIKKSINTKLKNWGNSIEPFKQVMAVGKLGKGLWKGQSTLETMENISKNINIPLNYRLIALGEASNAAEALNKNKTQIQFINEIIKTKNANKNLKMFLYSLFKGNYHHIQDNPWNWIKALHNYRLANKYFLRLQESKMKTDETTLIKSYKKGLEHGIASTSEKINRIFPNDKRLKDSLFLMNSYIENEKTVCDLDHLCDVLFIRAKIYIQMGELENSEKDYKKALEIAIWIKKTHSIIQGYRGLGRVYAFKGYFREAINSVEKAQFYETEEPLLKARNNLTLAWLNKYQYKRYKKEGIAIYKKSRGKIQGFIDSIIYLQRGR